MLTHQIKPTLETLQDNAVYRFADLKSSGWIPFCRSHTYALMAKGEFPHPVKLGKHAIGWTGKSIKDWHKSCIDAAA